MAKKLTINEIIQICNQLAGSTLRKYLNLPSDMSWEEATNQTFKNKETIKKNKGSYGNFIQQELFDIRMNSLSEPDFVDLGIELKVIPLKMSKSNEINYYYPKERVALSAINYDNIIEQSNLYCSDLYKKINHILFIYYIYENNQDKLDYKILNYKFFRLNQSNYENQIAIDYKKIYQKIFDGAAHELSESLTKWLGAATSGKNNKDLVRQPKSLIMANRRRFSFKPKFINTILWQKDNKIVLVNDTELETFNYIKLKINDFEHKTLKQILKNDYKKNFKNNKFNAIKRIFEVKNYGEIKGILENSIKIKNIELKNKKIKEEIPIVDISIDEFENDCNFQDSEFAQYLLTFKIVFVVWSKVNAFDDDVKIDSVFDFEFDDELLLLAEKVYNDTKNKFRNGMDISITTNSKGTQIKKTNLIKYKDNMGFHIRPHAANGSDTFITPSKQKITKCRFWLNKEILFKKLKV